MKAAMWYKKGDVRIVDVPEPKVSPLCVKIKIKWCGICGSDLHEYLGGPVSIPVDEPHPITGQTAPVMMGHELAGEVIELGDGVTGLSVGDVIISVIDIPCRECRFCRTGREKLCLDRKRLSFERDGSHAELCVIPAGNACKIREIPVEKASALTDAFASSYSALRYRADVRVLDRVLIMGAGGLGLAAIQLAKSMGAVVYAIDINENNLKVAVELGADEVIHTPKENPFDRVKKFTCGDMCDTALDFVGLSNTVDKCVSMVRPGGNVVLIGYKNDNFTAAFSEIIMHGRNILGHRGATRLELLEVIELCERGDIDPYVGNIISLDDINSGLDDLRAGKYPGRTVIKFE